MVRLQFSRLGGHRALDLVNTVTWRLDETRRRDLLAEPTAAAAWVDQFIPLTEAPASREFHAEVQLIALRAVREDLYAAAVEGDQHAAQRLLSRNSQWLRRCVPVRTASGRWDFVGEDVADDEHTAALVIASEAIGLMNSAAAEHIKQCSDSACGWIYLDTSRRDNRLWCAAEDCGARNRSRRYYYRNSGQAHVPQ